MEIELIPIVFFAWFFELSEFVQSNAGLLFFTPFLAIVWALGIILIMKRWNGK